MKKIKIKILSNDANLVYGYSYFLVSLLKKHFEVEFSDNPDYIFYNESTLNHYKYDCIKIFYTGENISPNFNVCDYAIGFDHLTFEDRYYRLPLYLVRIFYNLNDLLAPEPDYLSLPRPTFTKDDLSKKKEFCSFVYSNYRSDIERKKMFEALSKYKKVNAAGAYLNNTGGKKLNDKLTYESEHKFSIAFENSSRSGYTTEKLIGSIIANTIPIYWGNPTIAKEFNTRRFINCHDYQSFEDVVAKVKELDQNDELYLKMINEPLAADGHDFSLVRKEFEKFLKNIFDQPLEKAKRATINPVQAIQQKKNISLIYKYVHLRSFSLSWGSKIYKPLKKISFFEKWKQNYFAIKK